MARRRPSSCALFAQNNYRYPLWLGWLLKEWLVVVLPPALYLLKIIIVTLSNWVGY